MSHDPDLGRGPDFDPGSDPLRELHGAFADLTPPPAARELADEDAATRAAVAWMASTWSALEAPAPPRNLASARRDAADPATLAPAPRLALLPRLAVALAASLAVWLGFAVTERGDEPTSTPGPSPDLVAALPEALPAALPEALPTEQPMLLAANDERVELRSGAVRLLLLQRAPSFSPLPEGAGAAAR